MAAMRSSFRGAVVGALIGDCLGAYFEGDMLVPMKDALQHFNAVKTSPGKKEGNGGVGRRLVQPRVRVKCGVQGAGCGEVPRYKMRGKVRGGSSRNLHTTNVCDRTH